MIKKNLLICSAFIFIFIIQNLSANEIISRHLYNVGDQVKYKIDRILPNESSYITGQGIIVDGGQTAPENQDEVFHPKN